MLKNFDLDRKMSDRDYVGTGYKGYALGFHWQSAPDYIWTLAEKYLGLAAGALDNVYAIAVSFESTAMGRVVDLGVKLVDATEVRGIKAQPLNMWGHEAFRKSYVIGSSTLSTTYLSSTLSLTEETRLYPCAPAQANKAADNTVSVPVYGNDGEIIGFKVIAKGPNPNGGNFKSGLDQVLPVTATRGTGDDKNKVSLACATSGATIKYTTDGSTPTSASSTYSSAITISANDTVIKAIAIKAGMIPSDVFSQEYDVES